MSLQCGETEPDKKKKTQSGDGNIVGFVAAPALWVGITLGRSWIAVRIERTRAVSFAIWIERSIIPDTELFVQTGNNECISQRWLSYCFFLPHSSSIARKKLGQGSWFANSICGLLNFAKPQFSSKIWHFFKFWVFFLT